MKDEALFSIRGGTDAGALEALLVWTEQYKAVLDCFEVGPDWSTLPGTLADLLSYLPYQIKFLRQSRVDHEG